MDQIIASIKTLVATQNKTALSLDRIEKRVNARRYAEDYEEEENTEEIRQAQRVWREQASWGKKETYMPKKEDMQEGMKKIIIHGVKETYNKKRDDMQEGMRKIIIINEGKEIYIPELQGWTFPSLIDGDNPTGWIYKVDQFFDEGNLILITFPNPTWIMEIKMSYELDTEVHNCIIEKLGNKFTNSKYSIRSGLLLYKGRIMVAIWSLLQLKYHI